MTATIPLAKGFSEKHLKFPVFLSHKIDGVPVRIDIEENGDFMVRSRQAKFVHSVYNLVREFVDEFRGNAGLGYFDGPCTLIGEVYQHGDPHADFKDTSGIVRRQDDQSHRLALGLFEMFTPALQEVGFERRYEALLGIGGLHLQVGVVPQQRVETLSQLEHHFEDFCNQFPKAEGMVARNWDDPFLPGKRSWGYQKLLREPTIDLRIVGVEEAIDQNGNPKGMAGRLVASYKGNSIGIGPGRLTHDERRELWEQYKEAAECCCCGDPVEGHSYDSGHSPVSMADYCGFPCRLAQIKYKTDDSYDALRQPTFQFWRDDKETPDA